MRHHEIAGAMPGLKYHATTAFTDIGAMVDELAATPPGHERAGQLSQQIKSKIDGLSTAISDVQPDGGPAVTVTSVPARQDTVDDSRGDRMLLNDPHYPYEMPPVLAERFSDMEARIAALEHGPTDVHDHVYDPTEPAHEHEEETEKPADPAPKAKKVD